VVSDGCVVSRAVITIAAGNGLPLESRTTVGDVSSVSGGLFGSDDGMKSEIVPVT
jgi:hypothetical protein